MKPGVLFLTDQEEIVGGVEVGLLELLRHLDSDRFDYCLAGPSGPFLREASSLTRTVECSLRPLQTKPAVRALPQLWRRSKMLRTLADGIGGAGKPDLVHTLSFGAHLSGARFARRLGASLLWDVQDFFSHPFERFLLKRAANIGRPHGMFLGSETAGRFPSIGQGKRREIAAGVDLGRFSQSREDSVLRRECGIGTNDPVVGYAGQLIPRKRVEVLFEAAQIARRNHPGLHLVLIGDPSPRFTGYGEMIAKSADPHRWVHLLGARTDMERLLPDLDILVFPSLEEPFGRVMLEAIASRVPVVAAASSGAARALPGNAYCLAGNGTAESIGQAITSLFATPESMVSLAREGRKIAEEKFSATARARAVETYYGEILELD